MYKGYNEVSKQLLNILKVSIFIEWCTLYDIKLNQNHLLERVAFHCVGGSVISKSSFFLQLHRCVFFGNRLKCEVSNLML